jgi:uncharacterized protein (DUF58 family)
MQYIIYFSLSEITLEIFLCQSTIRPLAKAIYTDFQKSHQSLMQAQRAREILKKVRQLEIRSNRLVTNSLAGTYHSVFKGQGMEFEQVREYSEGDDVRSIDWNVTARMGKPFVKLFREERELTVMLLVDISASGEFGSVNSSKREHMAEIAATIAFSAMRGGDKVGLVLFSDCIEHTVLPKKGAQHTLRLIRDLLFFSPKGTGTRISQAAQHVSRILNRKAAVFLLSDFHSIELISDLDALALMAQRHDVRSILIRDPHESKLPDVGLVTLQDAETGEIVELNTGSKSIREEFAQNAAQAHENLIKQINKRGIRALTLETDAPYTASLEAFLGGRPVPQKKSIASISATNSENFSL